MALYMPVITEGDLIVAIDVHLCPPPAPGPPAPLVHAVTGRVDGGLSQDDISATVFANGKRMAQEGRKVDRGMLHVPNGPTSAPGLPSITSSATIIMSCATVLVENVPIASRGAPTLCCGDPLPTTSGLVLGMHDVFVPIGLRDVLAALARVACAQVAACLDGKIEGFLERWLPWPKCRMLAREVSEDLEKVWQQVEDDLVHTIYDPSLPTLSDVQVHVAVVHACLGSVAEHALQGIAFGAGKRLADEGRAFLADPQHETEFLELLSELTTDVLVGAG